MKTGSIVYLADAHAVPPDLDLEAAAVAAGLDPESTVFAASVPGYFRVQEALLELAARGFGRIDLAKALFEPSQGLAVAPQRRRVWG